METNAAQSWLLQPDVLAGGKRMTEGFISLNINIKIAKTNWRRNWNRTKQKVRKENQLTSGYHDWPKNVLSAAGNTPAVTELQA